MNESEARTRAQELNAAETDGGRWLAKEPAGSGDWEVVRIAVAGLPGADPTRAATTAPPPTRPDPSQDIPVSPTPYPGTG